MTKASKKMVQKVTHPPYITVTVNSGMAASAPPLGPQMSSRGVKIVNFCKTFNERTGDLKPGIPIPTEVFVNPDRSFDLLLHKPTTSYFLKMAAGIQKGAMAPGKEVAGKVSLKHIYEIAKIKSEDPSFELVPLQTICKSIIGSAHTLGIEVVKELKPEEYGQFLQERKIFLEEREKELEEIQTKKLLRL